jgi:hypothetical protein
MAEPTSQEVAELIKHDPLVTYLVEQLGGKVVRITRRQPKTKQRPSSPASKPRAA